MATLRDLGRLAGCVVIGLDHAGKNAELGTRGASAKEANSDFILANLGEKKMNGEVENTRLALRKMRDGPQGAEIPFATKLVDMGHDDRGKPVTSRIIDWQAPPPGPAKPVLSESDAAFGQALSNALKVNGTMVTIREVERFAVAREHVRTAFRRLWRPDKELKASALDQRFRVALQAALVGQRVGKADHEGDEWIWVIGPM